MASSISGPSGIEVGLEACCGAPKPSERALALGRGREAEGQGQWSSFCVEDGEKLSQGSFKPTLSQ